MHPVRVGLYLKMAIVLDTKFYAIDLPDHLEVEEQCILIILKLTVAVCYLAHQIRKNKTKTKTQTKQTPQRNKTNHKDSFWT